MPSLSPLLTMNIELAVSLSNQNTMMKYVETVLLTSKALSWSGPNRRGISWCDENYLLDLEFLQQKVNSVLRLKVNTYILLLSIWMQNKINISSGTRKAFTMMRIYSAGALPPLLPLVKFVLTVFWRKFVLPNWGATPQSSIWRLPRFIFQVLGSSCLSIRPESHHCIAL